MNKVSEYIFLFLIGTTVMNLFIAVAARVKTKHREFNHLIYYWLSLFITYGAVVVLSGSTTQIAFSFFFQFIPCFLATKILRDASNVKTDWRLYLGLQTLAMGVSSWLLTQTDAGFTNSLIPVVLSTSFPFLTSAWTVLVTQKNEASWIHKGMGVFLLSAIVNNFNYAFFRLEESAAWWGWGISIAQYQALSIFLPLLINHRREQNERRNLELALSRLSGKRPMETTTEIDELYRTLELQIGQKEEYSRMLSEANAHLEEEREMNEILIRAISHDFANPLTVMNGYMQMIKSGRISSDDVGRIHDRLLQNLKSAMDMVARIRRTVSTRNEADLIKVTSVDLALVIRMVANNFEQRLQDKNIELRMTGLSDVKVLADEKALAEHVFTNILSNAVKFSYENGRIDINVRDLGATVEVEFRDHGVGISSTRNERYRYLSTPGTKGEEGTGFGLIVLGYFLRKFHAGLKIDSHSQSGSQGTSFTVILKKPMTLSRRVPETTANLFS